MSEDIKPEDIEENWIEQNNWAECVNPKIWEEQLAKYEKEWAKRNE